MQQQKNVRCIKLSINKRIEPFLVKFVRLNNNLPLEHQVKIAVKNLIF